MSQRGSIRRRGETWTAYWSTTDPDGSRRQRTRGGFPTKRTAQAHLTQVVAEVARGSWVEPSRTTVADYLTGTWLPSLDRRPATIAQYATVARAWIVPAVGSVPLHALTPAHVAGMVASLRASGGKGGRPLGDRSVQLAHTILRAALDEAVRHGLIGRNAAALVRRPAARSKEMRAWTAEQAGAFLDTVAADRLYALWLLLLTRGPRRGELIGLRWVDVDHERGQLAVRRTRVMVTDEAGSRVIDSTPKTSAGTRVVPLDDDLLAALRAHRARQAAEQLAAGVAWEGAGHVFGDPFGRPLHPEWLSAEWGRLVARSGQPTIRLHDGRHTMASLALEAGVPVEVVSIWLGHSRPSITSDIYTHVRPALSDAGGQRITARVLGARRTSD